MPRDELQILVMMTFTPALNVGDVFLHLLADACEIVFMQPVLMSVVGTNKKSWGGE